MVKFVKLDQSPFTADDVVRRFWDLETLGITDKQVKSLNARDSTPTGISRLVLTRGSAESCLPPLEGKHHSTEQSPQC